MARPPDNSIAVPARHNQTSPLSVKLSPPCVLKQSQRARFTDGGLSFSVGKYSGPMFCFHYAPGGASVLAV